MGRKDSVKGKLLGEDTPMVLEIPWRRDGVMPGNSDLLMLQVWPHEFPFLGQNPRAAGVCYLGPPSPQVHS